jgi:hypothetical protein
MSSMNNNFDAALLKKLLYCLKTLFRKSWLKIVFFKGLTEGSIPRKPEINKPVEIIE